MLSLCLWVHIHPLSFIRARNIPRVGCTCMCACGHAIQGRALHHPLASICVYAFVVHVYRSIYHPHSDQTHSRPHVHSHIDSGHVGQCVRCDVEESS